MKISKSKIIYVDVDGTICSTIKKSDRSNQPIDYNNVKPFRDRIKLINELFEKGHTIVYWTARGGQSGIDFTELTKKQLSNWGAKYHELQVGNKPHFDLYICDKSYNAESWFHRRHWDLP